MPSGNDNMAPLFTWRTAIIHSDLASTTRHVLLTLSVHMSEAGESCFPSTARLARETGLSERAICTHLAKASEAGWILKRKIGLAGKKWKRHEYVPQVPADLLRKLNPYQSGNQGTEQGSAAPASEPHKKAVDKPVDSVGATCGKLNSGTEPHAEGTEPHDIKALNDVQSSTSINSTKSTSRAGIVDNFKTIPDHQWVAQGEKYGLSPRIGEVMPTFINRVRKAMETSNASY